MAKKDTKEKTTRQVNPFEFDTENKIIMYNASFLKRLNAGDEEAQEALSLMEDRFPNYTIKLREATSGQKQARADKPVINGYVIKNYVDEKGTSDQKKKYKALVDSKVTFFVLKKWFTDTFVEEAKDKALLATYNHK